MQKSKVIPEKALVDMDYNELTAIFTAEINKDVPDTKKQKEVMKFMRTWLRNSEQEINQADAEAKQESEKQKRILKETKAQLSETRTGYLETYRVMNSFITSNAMVTKVADFKISVEEFKKSTAKFAVALDAHIDKLVEAEISCSNE